MINVLITGSNGQLGSEISSLQNKFDGLNFFLTDADELDITKIDQIEKSVSNNLIGIIINCAAYTNVDLAEDDEKRAFAINSSGVKNLATVAKNNGLKLIHISTDYVFSGDTDIAYTESDATDPKNIYGISKLDGEKEMQKINPDNSLIIRTSWLYSSFGENFVKTILRLSKTKNEINVVSDQIGSPTYAGDLAETILKIIPLIKNKGVQVFHYANKGRCSWFEFAKKIVKLSGERCEVIPVTSAAFNVKVKRPAYSLLNAEKTEKSFGIQIPKWQESLQKCMLKLEVRNG